jgi:hypothetical protein
VCRVCVVFGFVVVVVYVQQQWSIEDGELFALLSPARQLASGVGESCQGLDDKRLGAAA